MGSPPHPSPSIPVRVAPATSNELATHGLRSALEPYAAAIELLDITAAQRADVVLLDTAGLPEGGVAETAATVTHLGRPVLVLTDHADERTLLRLLRAGARGVVSRPYEPPRLVEHLVTLAGGGIAVDPDAAVRATLLASRLLDLDRPPAELLGISRREVQVLELLADGATAREIGARLFVSHETVRSHLKRIYRKLGVHDRDAAVRRSEQEGILPD